MQVARRQRDQDPGPGIEYIGRDLARVVQAPELNGASSIEWQRGAQRYAVNRIIDIGRREFDQLLGTDLAHVRGDHPRIRQKVGHALNRAGGHHPTHPADLHRRRSTRQDIEPGGGRVPSGVDQHIELVRQHLQHDLVSGHVRDVRPARGHLLVRDGHRIVGDLRAVLIEIQRVFAELRNGAQDLGQQRRQGMTGEVAADQTDPQALHRSIDLELAQ